ncbi:MAG: hypothetical protein J5594_01525 [Elusimicrobiaceae bacterium]|nr:hypothetical protein [Elusimicrobiaceae bacterium]
MTPILALSVVAAGVKINSKEELATLLEKFNIPVEPEASILDLHREVYLELKKTRLADDMAIDHMDKIQQESLDFLNRALTEDINIVDYCESYLRINQSMTVAEELQNLSIDANTEYTLADFTDAKFLFEQSCKRAKVNPHEVIIAYNNLTQLPELTESIYADEHLLTEFTRQLSVYKGNFVALNEIRNTNNRKDMERLVTKYIIEHRESQKNYLKGKQKLEKLFEQLDYNANPVLYNQITTFQRQVEDMNLKNLENEGRMQTVNKLCAGKEINTFTKSGALFLGVLALIDITQHLIKVNDIKSYTVNRNRQELALIDAIEENNNNLFAFLEQLPDKLRNTAFSYIAENHFDDFQNQTKDLLYALAVLEKSSLNTTHKNQKNIEQQVNIQFDKIYKNTEKKIKQDALNI